MPRYTFCECESRMCDHERSCRRVDGLSDCVVATIRQTLCEHCKNQARSFCSLNGWEFNEVEGEV